MGDKCKSSLLTLSCPDHHDRLVSGLWNFFTSQHAVDFDFGCGRTGPGNWGAIRAHRLLLEVFLSPSKLRPPVNLNTAGACSDPTKGQQHHLVVNERDRMSLESVLEFLYKGSVVVRQEQLDDLLELAKRLDFQLLADTVVEAVGKNVNDGIQATADVATGQSSQFGAVEPQWNFQVPDNFAEPKTKVMSEFEDTFGGVCTPVHLVGNSLVSEGSDVTSCSTRLADNHFHPTTSIEPQISASSRPSVQSDCSRPTRRATEVPPKTGSAAADTVDSRTEKPSDGPAAPLEFIKSLHGNDLLVYSGYLFSKERLFGDKIFWSCVESKRFKCPGRCHTTEDRVTKFTDNHNHVPDAGKIGARRVMDRVKQRALSSGERIDQVIQDATSEISQTFTAHLPSISLMRRTLQRARQMHSGLGRETLRNPASLRELHLPRDFQETATGEPFLLFDSGAGDDRLLLFATSASLQLLSRCERWYCDGTFRAAPPLFAHLFTIHGVRHPNIIPCVFALLPGKTETSFGRLFAALDRLQPNLHPGSIVTGFDVAAANSLGQAYPGTALRGCFFHMSQCVWRHVQNIDGMGARYSSDPEFALQVRLLTALAYVPEMHVVEAFEALKVTPYYLRERRTLQPLLDYFEDTWVGRVDKRTPPLFLPSVWNCYETAVQGQAINAAIESWHRSFDKLVRAGRLNVWKFMSGLKQEQAASQQRIEQLLAGHETVEPRKKYRDGTKHILKVVEDYGRRHLIDYLTAIANNLSLSV